MEELQDAIEDVQYMNAMHDDIPRPTQDRKWPSPEEFQLYLDKVKTTAPRSFEAEGLCRGSLGFYTVSTIFFLSPSFQNWHFYLIPFMKVHSTTESYINFCILPPSSSPSRELSLLHPFSLTIKTSIRLDFVDNDPFFLMFQSIALLVVIYHSLWNFVKTRTHSQKLWQNSSRQWPLSG